MAAAALGLVVAPVTASARGPSDRYLEMVRTYAAGDHERALADLAGWTDAALDREVEAVRDLAEEARDCAACEARRSLEALPVRAAVLLHTDRDVKIGTPVSGTEEFSPVCGRRVHDVLAERLLDVLPRTPASKDFARRWYLTMILRTHWDLCSGDAGRWARGGARWSPADPELLLARGTAEELNELRRSPLDARRRVLDPTSRKPRGKLPEERRDLLHQARDSFRQVLALDPHVHEARLRLGRVLWRLGRMKEARSSLEMVVARPHDPEARVSYLAHLFLGQVEEDEGRLREAVDHYRKALDADPAAHAAGVALSHALFLVGDRVGARDTLERALRASSHRSGDAFWSYRAGEYKKAPAILDELRQEAVR